MGKMNRPLCLPGFFCQAKLLSSSGTFRTVSVHLEEMSGHLAAAYNRVRILVSAMLASASLATEFQEVLLPWRPGNNPRKCSSAPAQLAFPSNVEEGYISHFPVKFIGLNRRQKAASLFFIN